MRHFIILLSTMFTIGVCLGCQGSSTESEKPHKPISSETGITTTQDKALSETEKVIGKLDTVFKFQNIAFNEKSKEFYFPDKSYSIQIPQGASLSLIGKAAYKDLEAFETKFGFGGIKASYEIMSEINGIYDSKRIEAGDKLEIYSLGAMKIRLIDIKREPHHLVWQVANGNVKINSIKAH